MTLLLRTALSAWLLLAPVPPGLAGESARPPAIPLTGEGVAAQRLTRESLAALPMVTKEVAFQTSKGEVKGVFEGVLLWLVLEKAGLLDDAGHHAELRRSFTAVGRDGYRILFSVGEIAPDFGGTPAMIALKVDGAPLPAEDGLRLIVPGDTRGARNVRDVVAIEVR